jgi:hypothetical protein
MNDCENCKRIAEGAVNDVPEFEDFLGSTEEEDAFGERGLAASDGDSVFEFEITGAAKTEKRDKPWTEAGGLEAQERELKRTFEIDPDHAGEGEEHGHVLNIGLGGQLVESFQARAKSEFLCGELLAKRVFNVLHLFHGKFGSVEISGNLGVEIAAYKTGESDAEHAPEGHAGDISKFKGSVKGDDHGSGSAKDHVEI